MDVGWNTDEALETLKEGLSSIGTDLRSIESIVVTHIHPDHYGLAGRVREISGAKVALHHLDAALTKSRYLDPRDLLLEMRSFLLDAGAPKEQVEELQTASLPALDRRSFVEPDIEIQHEEIAPIPGRSLKVIWTPGHSPGHICLYEGRSKRLFSGDHILPRITANISYHPQSGDNPLRDYLESLEKINNYDIEEVEPAHEYQFKEVAMRIKEIQHHHIERLVEIKTVLKSPPPKTAWDVAQELTWSRPFNSYPPFMKRMAVGETVAHLKYLISSKEVIAHNDNPVTYSPLEL